MIRRCQPDELNWVRSAWLKSYSTSEWALYCSPKDDSHTLACEVCGMRRLICKRVEADGGRWRAQAGGEYWDGQRAVIERLVAVSNVSCLEADDGLLDAFAVRHETQPVVHWVHVRASVRGTGAAKKLLHDLLGERVTYTHKPRGLTAKRVPRGWKYASHWLLLNAWAP